MPALSIRFAEARDIPSVRALLVETWHDTYDPLIGAEKVTEITDAWHSIEALSRQLRMPDTSFVVAESAGAIVGHLFGNATRAPVLMIARLYVLPESQRRGIGKLLLDDAIRRYPGCDVLRLEVEAENAKGLDFYRREGFEPVGEKTVEGIRHFDMEKRLRVAAADGWRGAARRPINPPILPHEEKMPDVKKVVLAYSGGLDTSIILKWLQTTYRCEVVTFTADLGQGEELEPARKKAEMLGIKEIFIEDLREEFVRDFVFPMFRMNALYEGVYLLGTSIARPLIAKRLVEIAAETGADAIAHGATGKGNDQVRFELTAYALNPDIRIIAPWREWEFKSRSDLIAFAEENQILVAKDKRGEAPFSVDANLLHSSSEGKVLEDPNAEPPPYVFQRTRSPEEAPDKATTIEIGFERGDATSLDGTRLSPAKLLAALNDLGRDNGIGRVDLVENRFVGMKSRGIYETPGGTILHVAHRAIESITLDRGAAHLKDELMPRYAELVYNGFWFSPEREMIQAMADQSQEHVAGTVRLKAYKGNVTVVGRASPNSLYSDALVTFEDDRGAYDQRDAAGFIRLNALRLRTLAMRDRLKEP